MIRLLRNVGLNLWLATLVTIPASFFILAGLKTFYVDLNPVVCTATIFLLSLVAIGFLVHIIARKMISRLLSEGQAWERAGVVFRAQKAYIRAVRVYDTFIFHPFSGKKVIRDICGAMALFAASHGPVHSGFESATTTYLKACPEDEDIAMIWLQRIRNSDEVTPDQQAVLGLLAEQHYRKAPFLDILAEIFINLERKDFAAQKIFRRLVESGQFAEKYADRISPVIASPHSTLGGMYYPPDAPPDQSMDIKEEKHFGVSIKATAPAILNTAKAAYAAAKNAAVHIRQVMIYGIEFARHSQRFKNVVKYGFLFLMFIWLAGFMVNTITHLFKTEAVVETPVKEVAKEVPKPFTIQVAAYLKLEHANRYVESLKAKGIDAQIKKVDGGGKSWYLVRVSEFADKKSAAEYGNKLKQENMIEDFFVNNK